MSSNLTKGAANQPSSRADVQNMVRIQGGTFRMGSNDFYPEEQPVHHVQVDEFLIDKHPVTNAEFRSFIEETNYTTVAERKPNEKDYPGVDPELLVPGSLVFRKPDRPVSLNNVQNWWHYVPGACWKHPEGPESTLEGRSDHPVVHIAWEDAVAFAKWAKKELPTEAEWEYAARGGLEQAAYVWGDERSPNGKIMANTWQGQFPWQNLCKDGYEGTSPVGVFPANGYGLYDMAGNMWEWTSDFYRPRQTDDSEKSCCVARNPNVESACQSDQSEDQAGEQIPRRVLKGGSHLCAPNYCLRYRPAARQGQSVDSSTSHVGLRCIIRAEQNG